MYMLDKILIWIERNSNKNSILHKLTSLRTNSSDLQIYYVKTTMYIHIINMTLAVLNNNSIYHNKECRT